VLYSWPSEGRVGSYPTDANNAQWTVPHLTHFLKAIADRSGAQMIHLVSHSMGGQPLVAALHRLSTEQSASEAPPFRQVVLAAPDVDASIFRGEVGAMKKVARRVTLYASSHDYALVTSKRYQGYQRAGDTRPKLTLVEGLDTIDASEVDTSLLGHSYIGDVRTVVEDLTALLREGMEPSRRPALRLAGQAPETYWAFPR